MHKRSLAHWSRLCSLGTLALAACSADPVQAPTVFSSSTQEARFVDPGRPARLEATFPALDEIFRHHAEEQHFPGSIYAVVIDGELVHSMATGVASLETQVPVDLGTQFLIASLTKSFTAMAILRLRDEGRLSLADPVSRYLPEAAGFEYLTSDAPEINIGNLLTMTGGLPEDNPWADRHLADTEDELIRFLEAGVSFANVPSGPFEYSNLGYAMLGLTIRRITGESAQDYISREILVPLGMHDTHWEYSDVPAAKRAHGYRWQDGKWALEPVQHTGAFACIGGLITSMEDFAKYVGFHLDAWPARSAPETGPLRRSSVREMHRPATFRLRADAKDSQGRPDPQVSGYGYGLGVRTNSRGVTGVSHTGGLPGFGSNYKFFPQHGVAVISFANRTYGDAWDAHVEAIDTLFEQGTPPRRELPASAILQQRAGQVVELIQTWDDVLSAEILADNFYLDYTKEHRARGVSRMFEEAGTVVGVDNVQPINQLRGHVTVRCEHRDLRVFFTLSPEAAAKVQRLDVRIQDKQP